MASNVGGLPEVVSDSKTGLLYQVGDVNSLVHCLRKLLDNRAIHQCMRIAAQAPMLEHFSIEKMVQAHEGIYATILAMSLV